MLRIPQIAERFDDLVRRCLTTPYDYELLDCYAESGRLRACTLAFQSRSGRPLELR